MDLKTYYVKGSFSYVAHFSSPKPEKAEEEENGSIVTSFIFPFASYVHTSYPAPGYRSRLWHRITLISSYAYTMRVVPIDGHRTETQYDVYPPTEATNEAFDETHKFFVQVEEEDKFLCVRSHARVQGHTSLIHDHRRLTRRRTWRLVYIPRAHCTRCVHQSGSGPDAEAQRHS